MPRAMVLQGKMRADGPRHAAAAGTGRAPDGVDVEWALLDSGVADVGAAEAAHAARLIAHPTA